MNAFPERNSFLQKERETEQNILIKEKTDNFCFILGGHLFAVHNYDGEYSFKSKFWTRTLGLGIHQ